MRINAIFNDYQSRIIKGMTIESGDLSPCATLKIILSEKIKSLSEEDKKRYLKLADNDK